MKDGSTRNRGRLVKNDETTFTFNGTDDGDHVLSGQPRPALQQDRRHHLHRDANHAIRMGRYGAAPILLTTWLSG